MLRILVFEEPFSIKFRLEGELTAETASELNDRWTQIRGRLRERKAILDLGDVTEVDEAGRHVLASLAGDGVRVGYAQPKLESLVRELEGVADDGLVARIRKRVSGSRNSSKSSPSQLFRIVQSILS